MALGWACAAALSAAGATYHVDDVTGNDGNDGSPGAPFKTIQIAINTAVGGDTVLVADGIYKGSGNVGLNFGGKAITVKSASGSPNACILDGENTSTGVQFITGEGLGSVLDGFTLQNCRAATEFTPGESGHGGAIRIVGANPTIQNCRFLNNVAEGVGPGSNGLGGAIYAGLTGGATIINCTFVGNLAKGGDDPLGNLGAGEGGAVYGDQNFTFEQCTFTNNESRGGTDGLSNGPSLGGAVRALGSDMTNCEFVGNRSASGGALFWVFRDGAAGASLVYNCAFVNNEAVAGNGGAIVGLSHIADLINCTFARNLATGDGGAAFFDADSSVIVRNSIFWLNDASGSGDAIETTGDSNITIGLTLIQGGVPTNITDENDNLDQDPIFVQDPSDGNPGNVRLDFGSPCVNVGDDSANPTLLDLDLNPRIFDGQIDLGAFEQGVSPVGMIQDIKSSVDGLVTGGATLPAHGKPLKVKLDAAIAAIQNGNNATAISRLQDFINQCNAMVNARRLTRAQADDLIAQAQSVIALLQP